MDLLLPLQATVGFLAMVIFFYLARARTKNSRSNSKEAPQPAGSWPIIGHLLLLGSRDPLFRTLGAMADKYGPAFTLWLGMNRALIVSSSEVARECFTVNDKVLATRPKSAAGKYMSYSYTNLGLAPYGPYWRQMRKIATLELLSIRRLESLKHIRVTEINLCIRELYGLWEKNDRNPVKVEMQRWFRELVFNAIVMMIAGKRCSGDHANCDEIEMKRFNRAIERLMHIIGVFVVSDALPFLEWMDLGGQLSAMKGVSKEFDSILAAWLEEHRQKRLSGECNGDQDFMDVLLSVLKDEDIPGHDLDTVIKSIPLTLIIAGTDTTSIALTWALTLLLNNPEVLKKAQEELDFRVGNGRQVNESDVTKLVYLQAIVKETLRLYPPGPLGLPHEAIEDCHINGFHVPAGTQVVVNIWKLHRDPHKWSNPTNFQPERFLHVHMDVDFKDQHCEFIPFGAGRRSCPGISLAVQVMQLALARLLHSFDMDTPSNAPVDMSEGVGVSLAKATPLEVVLTPRLSAELY